MICCLNPDCDHPINSDNQKYCQNCGTILVPLLRNHYKIVKPLGRGGFGKTYLAEDTDKLNEPCVVKLQKVIIEELLQMSALFHPMLSGCTICTETCGNGVQMYGMKITIAHL
jgi:serine/threonine protein kinase